MNYNFNQHPIANWKQIVVKQQLSIAEVDVLADELVAEYSNPGYRRWYCGVIIDFGFAKVIEWRGRAKEGDYPPKLFSSYVSQARKYSRGGRDG